VLLALAYQQCKNQDMAVKILEELLLITKSEGYIRLFIDEGEKMKALLLETLRQNPRLLDDVILNKHVNQVLDAFATKTGSKTQIASSTDETKNTSKSNHAPLIEALSGREMQVLALIGNGKSYDQIANELFVALSTVQWHVKNIYRKLSVHSGTEAVATARALGIL
jgi:LuxR family transcriptional regulator, maltose regulon positive regulatory protein